MDYHLGLAETFEEGRSRTVQTEQEFAKAERTVPGQRSPHNGSQAGNPGAAQEREKGEERELNMEGKELNNLGLVTPPLASVSSSVKWLH